MQQYTISNCCYDSCKTCVAYIDKEVHVIPMLVARGGESGERRLEGEWFGYTLEKFCHRCNKVFLVLGFVVSGVRRVSSLLYK